MCMNEEKMYAITEEEYEILCFYRELPEKKQEKFKKLLVSLRKVLLDEDDDTILE